MIVCAAIRYKEKVIIGGPRHADARLALSEMVDDVDWKRDVEEGFFNQDGEFLSREQAFHEAIKCGQICAQVRYDKSKKRELELYSEDLY